MFDFSAKGWNFLAKAMCGMCVLWMLIGAVIAVFRWNYLQRAITTQATITGLMEKQSDDGDTMYAPVYVFTDQQGQSVRVISTTASFPPPGAVGDKMEVLYDPRNPQDSMRNRFFSIWGFPAIFGGIGAFYFVVFGTVAFFTERHLRRKAEQGGGGNSSALRASS